MNIIFKNAKQVKLANMLWNADSISVVDNIVKTYGHDALIVYHMIVAESFDQCQDIDVEDAKILLNRIKNKL